MKWVKDHLQFVHLKHLKIVSVDYDQIVSEYISCIGPGDAPRDFTSIPTMTDVTFNWSIPATPNGIITQYSLTVVNLVTGVAISYSVYVAPYQQQVSQLVTGFRPYENYTATVTGTTLVGYGPVAVTEGRTKPDSKLLPLLLFYSFSVQHPAHQF